MTASILMVGYGVPYPIEVGADAARYGLIAALGRQFKLTLVLADGRSDADSRARALREHCDNVTVVPVRRTISARHDMVGLAARNFNLLVRGVPRGLQPERAPTMAVTLRAVTRDTRFDLAHFDYWTTAEYRRFADCPAALLNFDAWFETIDGYARQAGSPLARLSWTLEASASRRREVAAQRAFDWSLFFTDEDRGALERAGAAPRRSALVPLASPFPPIDDGSLNAAREHIVLFSGALGAPFNIDALMWFVRDIWPLVRTQVPDATLVITGREPTSFVQSLSSAAGVTLAGWIPDLEELQQRAAVFIAPMRIGTGVKVKVAHAMSRGLPVVATSLALRGLPQTPGVIAADEVDIFAKKIVEILTSATVRQTLAHSVVKTYREKLWLEAVWPNVVQLYERILADVATTSRRPQ